MNKSKRTKTNYWMVRIPSFPEEKRRKVQELANKERISTAGFIGNLLEKEIREDERASL